MTRRLDDDEFQSTLPVRGATPALAQSSPTSSNFNPRSPCGERRVCVGFAPEILRFQSTLPVRGATYAVSMLCYDPLISIHAPRAGSDLAGMWPRLAWMISIHAPRAGSDDCCVPCAWGYSHFNPRSPCGERHTTGNTQMRPDIFQSTLPVRGATRPLQPPGDGCLISIHAPRAGSDPTPTSRRQATRYFNPRSPCGERLKRRARLLADPEFQSTLPVRGATTQVRDGVRERLISIHAPRAGSDTVEA